MIVTEPTAAQSSAIPAMVALPEGLRYFIVRPDNTMTPLVPADQLPFQILGLPRQLTPQQLSKERWEWVTNTKEPKSQLAVQAPATCLPALPPSAAPRNLAPDHYVRAASKSPAPVNDKALPLPSTNSPEAVPKSAFTFSRPVETEAGTRNPFIARPSVSELGTQPKSLAESIASAYPKDAQRIGYPQILPPSGIRPDPKKKVYCTHWIKTGDCAFKEQGCLYKHEMPSLDKLREIGFRQIPLWWKEKSALQLRGPTWMERQRRMQEEKEEEEGKADPAPINKSIRNVFKGLRKEYSRDDDKEEHARRRIPYSCRVLDRDSSGTLIDAEPAAPPPSRRSSCDSISTAASGESRTSSSMSSVQSTSSEKQSTTGANQKSHHRAVSTHGPMASSVRDTLASDKEKHRREIEVRSPLQKQSIVSKVTKASSSEAQVSAGIGMAKSVHAVKSASGTKSSSQLKTVRANEKTLSKRSSKHTKEQPRRERKPRPVSAPAPAPLEKEMLIEL